MFLIPLFLFLPCTTSAHKIFILMSYQKNDKCGNPQLRGVIDALRYEGYDEQAMQIFFLNSRILSQEELQRRKSEALNAFKEYKPDVTVSIDDLAFQTMAPYFLGKKGRGFLVFTGTNISPEDYNRKYHFHQKRRPIARITGVYEKFFIKKQLRFIKLIFGEKNGKIPVLYSSDLVGTIVLKQILDEVSGTPYKKWIMPMKVDTLMDVKIAAHKIQKDPKIKAYIPLTVAIKSDDGSHETLTIKDVAPVLQKIIKKPELTINAAFVDLGFWGGVSVDFYEMGYRAGQMAAMLLKGYHINSIKIKDAHHTVTIINLKRNQEIGLRLPVPVMGMVDTFIR